MSHMRFCIYKLSLLSRHVILRSILIRVLSVFSVQWSDQTLQALKVKCIIGLDGGSMKLFHTGETWLGLIIKSARDIRFSKGLLFFSPFLESGPDLSVYR